MSLGGKYIWTEHSRVKMRQYRLTPSRLIRILRHPVRIEEGILEGAVACMQPAGGKHYSEIWLMYVIQEFPFSGRTALPPQAEISEFGSVIGGKNARGKNKNRKIVKIITAWRYPGKSPEREPVPQEVLREIKGLIFN